MSASEASAFLNLLSSALLRQVNESIFGIHDSDQSLISFSLQINYR